MDLHNDGDPLARWEKLILEKRADENQRRPRITSGRAFREVQRYYVVQRRLLGPMWPSSLISALREEREHGATVREAVARVYRRLRRIQRSRGCQ